MNKQLEVKNMIAQLTKEAYEKAVQENELPKEEYASIEVEPTKDKSFGDFSVNFAMKMSKALRKNPREIAGVLIKYMPEHRYIAKVETAGPGFMNFYLTCDWLYDNVSYIRENE